MIDNDGLLVIVLAQAVLYGTPLLYASLGELLAERSGVLNLGVEGMMVFGAAVGFWATQRVHGSTEVVLAVAVVAAALSGAAMALIHAFLTITMRASQIVSGLALTIFAGGLGLSAYFGNELHLAELPATDQFKPLDILGLGDVAFFGPILFDQSALVYLSERVARESGKGRISQLRVDTGEGHLLVVRLDGGGVLAATTAQEARVGLVLYDMRNARGEVEKALAEGSDQ